MSKVTEKDVQIALLVRPSIRTYVEDNGPNGSYTLRYYREDEVDAVLEVLKDTIRALWENRQ